MEFMTHLTVRPEPLKSISATDSIKDKKTLILGLGNPLCGDDGLGNQVVQRLAAKHLPQGVKALAAGTPGWELPNWLVGWPKVILIDAVRMGLEPGARKRFDLEEVKLIAAGEILTSHAPDLATGLALAEALHQLPEEVIVFGIEPESCEPGTDISQSVKKEIDGLVDDILNEIA
jgi:hydrogenase maturation protease